MMLYTAEVFGWMTIIEADNKRDAVRQAKELAPSASLLPSDITAANVHRATQGEIDWYNRMAAAMQPIIVVNGRVACST